MATNSVLRQLHLVVMLMMMMTTLTAGKRFRLRSLGLRARFPPSQLKVVLARLDQLTSLVNDVQQAVEDTQGTVNVIKARVDPPATRQSPPLLLIAVDIMHIGINGVIWLNVNWNDTLSLLHN